MVIIKRMGGVGWQPLTHLEVRKWTVLFTGYYKLNFASGRGDRNFPGYHILILSNNLTNLHYEKSIFIAFHNTLYRSQNSTMLNVTFEKYIYLFMFLFIF